MFSVTADPDNKCLTVRTSNKKYFKKIVIPELERTGLLPDQENVSFTHKFNTLIITVSIQLIIHTDFVNNLIFFLV